MAGTCTAERSGIDTMTEYVMKYTVFDIFTRDFGKKLWSVVCNRSFQPLRHSAVRERATSGMQEQGSVSTDTQSDIFSAASPAEDGVSLRGANLQTPDGGRTRTVYDY